MQFKVVKSPSEQFSLSNCVAVSQADFDENAVKYVILVSSSFGLLVMQSSVKFNA